MNKLLLKFLFILFFLFARNDIYPQSCGFGCFGLSGFYGGYTYQQYNAEGLNAYLDFLNSPASSLKPIKIDEFKAATGFRVGANLFRFNYKNFLVSIKGYYQFLKEEHSFSEKVDNIETTAKLSLKLNYWGAGFDLGYSTFDFLDLKLIDAQVTFNSGNLNISSNFQNSKNTEVSYKNDNNITGYSIGCGFILKLADDYLSIETTAGYSNFNINNLSDDKDNLILGENTQLVKGKDFIKAGGLFITAQLNVGIPLY
jgi:hypothetical protein